MRSTLLIFATAPFLSGCLTHHALRQNTVCTASTLTDLNYQQVLDNVARFVVNPSIMPYFAVVNAGTVTVLDQKSASASATYNPTLTFQQQGGGALPILSLLFNPSASRSVTENWSLAPVTDVDNLRRIRCAFELVVLGRETTDCDDCKGLLKQFYLGESDRLECLIPRGWFHVGGKKDVPKAACYVGRCGDVYVWVLPDGMEGLTRFTMTVLDLATGKPHAPTKTVVKTYKADGKLDTTQVTTTEIDQEALDRLKKKEQRERPRSPGPPLVNPGYFFVPR
jgi:hypothetical protein